MKGLFIINPSSGKQNIDSMLREIMATLILDQICSHVDVFYTKGKDDAKNRAAELKPGDYDFIVSVGGDGTLNEVTNGLILSESNIPMAIISAGTVNDFATYMKLPQTADGFCQMIKDFQTKKVDVGRVNNEYFINVLAAGMLTDIAYKVPKDKVTTEDMLFTVETVSCLGACGLAPVLTVNDKVYPSMTPDDAAQLLQKLREEE